MNSDRDDRETDREQEQVLRLGEVVARIVGASLPPVSRVGHRHGYHERTGYHREQET